MPSPTISLDPSFETPVSASPEVVEPAIDRPNDNVSLDPDLIDPVVATPVVDQHEPNMEPATKRDREPEGPGSGLRLKPEEVLAEKILESLKNGVAPWHKPWASLGVPQNGASGREYRGLNPFILGVVGEMRGYTDPRWMTIKQINEAGGTIKKGEPSTAVYFWKFLDPKDKKDAKEKGKETGKPEAGEGPEKDEQDEKAKSDRKIPLIRIYRVWNVEQAEGLDLKPLPQARDNKPIPAAQAMVEGYLQRNAGLTVAHGGNSAYYAPRRDHIQLPPMSAFESPESYYGTLFHEAGHSTGHPDRLNRMDLETQIPPFGSQDYSKEELVAEMASALLRGHVGMTEDIPSTAAYCDGWLKRLGSEPKLLLSAASQAQKAVDMITGKTFEDAGDAPKVDGEKKPETIGGFRGEHAFLSNFEGTPVAHDGLTFKCAEAAFQAAKFSDPDYRAQFVGLNGGEARKLGKLDHPSLRADWDQARIPVMKEILQAKFSDPELQKSLLATGDMQLVEHNRWKDTFWGVCYGKGENNLGKLLMELRAEFASKAQA